MPGQDEGIKAVEEQRSQPTKCPAHFHSPQGASTAAQSARVALTSPFYRIGWSYSSIKSNKLYDVGLLQRSSVQMVD